MIIELKGTNKKLLHRAGMFTKKANLSIKKGDKDIFKFYTDKANQYLELLSKKLRINTDINFIAPCSSWDAIRIFDI